MGSFTQGGMAFGQGIGQGIKTYKEKKKRRDHNASKALAIRGQFDAAEEAGTLSAADSKLHKQLQNLEDLGSKKIESLVAEYETGEEMKVNSMKKSLLQYQVDAAQAGAQSRQGLADFTSKGYGETEAGFEGNVPSNLPEYLTRDYLEGDRGQMAAGAFPGEHYGDESKAVEYSVGGNPYLEETERRRAEDAEWFRSGQAEPLSAGAIEATGSSNFLDKSNLEPWRLEALKRGGESNAKKAARKKQASLNKSIEDLEGYFDRNPGLRPSEGNQDYGSARELASKQGELEALKAKNPWLIPSELKGLDPLVVPDTMADAPPLQPEAVEPEQTQQNLVGYETYGDGDGTPQAQLSDRMATRATGGTPATPVDERRGQLIDSLAQYNLTPTDRKQAIDMISEKYPKLKEFATTIVTADGEEIGSKVGNTFVKKAKGRVATPQGWRVKSRSVNQATGEETVIFENPKDLPSYVPTAAKYAETDPELTLTNENAPDSAQAKSFNEAAASSKGLIEDTRWMIEQTKKAGAIEQRMYPTFKAGIQTRLVAMRAQMRKVVVGTGSVSEFEQQMLRDAIPDSSDIFRWDSATIKRLESLGGMSERHVKYQGESIGLWDYKPIGEGGQSGVGGTDGDPLGKFSK